MTITKLDDESNTIYNFRVSFINAFSIDYPNLTEKDYIKYSKIVANIKFKECRYDSINYITVKKYII